jgi:hypothetical protein
LYQVEGDLIKVQYVNREYWPNIYWNLLEIWYQISDDDKIVTVYGKDLLYKQDLAPSYVDSIAFQFIETDSTLHSDIWLKKEKWFWCK